MEGPVRLQRPPTHPPVYPRRVVQLQFREADLPGKTRQGTRSGGKPRTPGGLSRQWILIAGSALVAAGAVVAWWVVVRGPDLRVEAPAPRVVGSDPAVPSLPPALLAAPVQYDLGSILRDLEGAVPRQFGDLDERVAHPGNDRVEVAFHVERSPFEARMFGDTARLAATLTYSGRAWYDPPLLPAISASCGLGEDRDPPRARVELSSHLRIDEDWVLRSEARVDLVEAESEADRDRCRITPLGIDVTGTALGGVRTALEGQREEINRQIAAVDLRSRLQGVWHTLQEPVELTDDVWLLVRPEAVTQGRVTGEGTSLTIEVGMRARPVIILGPAPDTLLTDLPSLESGEVPEAAEIYLEARLHYEETSALLMRELGDREVQLAGGIVRIRGLSLSGIGEGQVALEVSFDGTASGTIHLVGRPELDRDRGQIHVPDLDFDLETRNLLVGGLAWLARDPLVTFLRDRARIPVEQIMDAAQEQLLRGLNRDLSDEVSIEGEVFSTRLIDVVALRGALVVHAEADARAEFRVMSNSGPSGVE